MSCRESKAEGVPGVGVGVGSGGADRRQGSVSLLKRCKLATAYLAKLVSAYAAVGAVQGCSISARLLVTMLYQIPACGEPVRCHRQALCHLLHLLWLQVSSLVCLLAACDASTLGFSTWSRVLMYVCFSDGHHWRGEGAVKPKVALWRIASLREYHRSCSIQKLNSSHNLLTQQLGQGCTPLGLPFSRCSGAICWQYIVLWLCGTGFGRTEQQ